MKLTRRETLHVLAALGAGAVGCGGSPNLTTDAWTPDGDGDPGDLDASIGDAGDADAAAAFVPGVTMPFYEEAADVDAALKNIGNLPGVPRTPYPGTVTNGTTLIAAAGVYANYDFIDTMVEIRANAQFKNCRFYWSPNSTAPAVYGPIMVVALHGAGVSLITFEDCEIHSRVQRITNCFQGRNAKFYRTVFTGGVDQCDTANTGTAPQTFGAEVHDCFIGWASIWYDPTPSLVHNGDTMVHADGSQITNTLGYYAFNTTFGMWMSAYSGTGTPGSGSETNVSTAAYIHPQATMDQYRAGFLGWTRSDQSFRGVSRPVPLESYGGSFAAVMCNSDNGLVEQCYLSGARVPVNLRDPSLPATVNWELRRNTVYNDMVSGRPLNVTTKGLAFFGRSAKSYPLVHLSGAQANKWFDGTPVALTLT